MSTVTVSEYLAAFAADRGLNEWFAISGAGNVRILDAVDRHPELSFRCTHHEQAAVMAASAFFRTRGHPAPVLVTAGPGACNTLTGVASAFLDSIPVVLIAGQEKARYLDPPNLLRGKGVQGLDMVSIMRPVTKHATCVIRAESIRLELERSLHEATSGRPGPVWLEVPQDVQWHRVDPEALEGFVPPSRSPAPDVDAAARRLVELVATSRRPLLWIGHGIRLARAEEILERFLQRFQVPALVSWQAADLIPDDHPLHAGRAGTYGQRGANFALQSCDLLIALGTRLAIPQIGYEQRELAPRARKVVVEIDPAELSKFEIPLDLAVRADVGEFMDACVAAARTAGFRPDRGRWRRWVDQCHEWRRLYPPCPPDAGRLPPGRVNSYFFVDRLSDELAADDVIVTDMGTSLTCTHAAIRLKRGQRLLTSTGLGEMGFGLPGAIGACVGSARPGRPPRRTVLVGCDGSLQMNLQELQTLIHLQLPVKMFIFNNNGYLSIRHTQRALFEGRVCAASPLTGVSFPSLERLAAAYGYPFQRIDDSSRVSQQVREVLDSTGPFLCEVMMPEEQLLGPKSGLKIAEDGSLYSPPLEDLEPFLPRDELRRNMTLFDDE